MFKLFAKKEDKTPADGCPCKRTSCERHGDCEACRTFHAAKKKHLPFCEREPVEKKSRERGQERA